MFVCYHTQEFIILHHVFLLAEGGSNPEFNVALAQVIEQCRNKSVPKATIDQAIKGAVSLLSEFSSQHCACRSHHYLNFQLKCILKPRQTSWFFSWYEFMQC